jgi:hypothetical protein
MDHPQVVLERIEQVVALDHNLGDCQTTGGAQRLVFISSHCDRIINMSLLILYIAVSDYNWHPLSE